MGPSQIASRKIKWFSQASFQRNKDKSNSDPNESGSISQAEEPPVTVIFFMYMEAWFEIFQRA